MDFHDDISDASLGGDSIAHHVTRDDTTLTATSGGTYKLGKQAASLDTTQTAPRIGG